MATKASRRHKYSREQIYFLREKYRKYSLPILVWAFNETFGLDLTEGQIRSTLRNHHIRSGSSDGRFKKGHAPWNRGKNGRFKKGHAPWNRGKKGYMGANATSFKPGHLPHNHKPLWTERVDKNGYIEISVPEKNPYTGFPTRYKQKHVWIWEQANGKKPARTAVVFKDGDNRNFNNDNLLLVTRAELLAMNLHGYKSCIEDLKPSVLALAKMEVKAGIRIKPARGRRKAKKEKL